MSPPRPAQYKVEQLAPFHFAVLGPNPEFGKEGVSYSSEYLTVCTTDGQDDADMIAAALNLLAWTTKEASRLSRKAQKAEAA